VGQRLALLRTGGLFSSNNPGAFSAISARAALPPLRGNEPDSQSCATICAGWRIYLGAGTQEWSSNIGDLGSDDRG